MKSNEGDSRHVDPIGCTIERRRRTREIPKMNEGDTRGRKAMTNEGDIGDERRRGDDE